MSDDERESDSIGPDIDLEKIAEEGDDSTDGSGSGSETDGDVHSGDEEHSHGPDTHDHDDAPAGRTTAPQSEFTTKQAMIGALVTAVGISIAYALPGLLG